MIDLVYWIIFVVLVPIVLHVCVRTLSLMYSSILVAIMAIVTHGREIPVQLPE